MTADIRDCSEIPSTTRRRAITAVVIVNILLVGSALSLEFAAAAPNKAQAATGPNATLVSELTPPPAQVRLDSPAVSGGVAVPVVPVADSKPLARRH